MAKERIIPFDFIRAICAIGIADCHSFLSCFNYYMCD